MAKVNVAKMRDALRRRRDEARRQRVRVEREAVATLPATLDGAIVHDCRPGTRWQIPGRGLANPLTQQIAYRR